MIHCDSTGSRDLHSPEIQISTVNGALSGFVPSPFLVGVIVHHLQTYKRVFGNFTWSLYVNDLLSGGPNVPNIKSSSVM